MSKNILEALGKIDVALGGNANDAVNVIDALDQISQGAGSLKNSIDNINGMQMRICGTGEYDTETGIPTIENPVEGVFYLTPADQQNNNVFNEYYYKDGQWEMFGGASINVNDLFDLSDRMAKGVDDNGNIVNGAIIEGDIQNNEASGYYSYAEGYNTKASGHNSHAEGINTTASGDQSHAEGYYAIASGVTSHAEGYGTLASGEDSHAEGGSTTASGYQSHAEGGNTTALGETSHAEGSSTTASGKSSHAEGSNTTANHKSQHVFGEFNIADTSENNATERGNYIEIVGNGTYKKKNNARTLDWSGNEILSGSLTLAGSLTIGKGTADEVTITAAQLKSLIALLNQ